MKDIAKKMKQDVSKKKVEANTKNKPSKDNSKESKFEQMYGRIRSKQKAEAKKEAQTKAAAEKRKKKFSLKHNPLKGGPLSIDKDTIL